MSVTRILACTAATGLALVGLAGCTSESGDKQDKETPSTANEVTLLVHDSFHVPDELKADFEKDTGLKLNIVAGESGQTFVSKLVLTKDAPIADAIYGFTQSTSGELAKHNILTDTAPVEIPGGDKYALDSLPGAVPIDHGEVCANIDTAYFADNNLPEPVTLDDLADPAYKGLTVTPDPAQSDTGLAFFYATIAAHDSDWQGFWTKLKDNELKTVAGWSEAYEQEFSANGGTHPIVISYATSPAATISDDGTSASTKNLPETCYAQTEFAGVLKGAANPDGAAKVVEWLASPEVQAAIPPNMYMYPVREGIDLPDGWAEFAPAPDPAQVFSLDPSKIMDNRESWQRELAEIFAQ